MSNKLKTLSIDGNEILIEELPKSIRDVVDIFDRVREDMEDLTYEINVLNHAAMALNNKISAEVTEYLTALENAKNSVPEAKQDKPVELKDVKKPEKPNK